MGILSNKLPHTVTWWQVTGGDGFGGDVFAVPTLLSARWEDRQETFYGVIDRRELISKAVVYLNQDVAVGDYLCQGDQTGQSNPSTVKGAAKIQKYDKVSDLRNVDWIRRAIL